MIYVRVIILSFFILLPVCSAMAQDSDAAQEFLRWLPDRHYIIVAFDNVAALRVSKSYNVFRSKVVHRLSKGPELYLPAFFADDIQWVGFATTIKFRLSPSEVDPEKETLSKNIDVSNRGERLFIARVKLNAEMLKDAVSAGEIVLAKEQIGDSPVFSYKGKSATDGFAMRYGFVDGGEYFISANSVRMLRLMVATYNGEAATILDSPDYKEFQDLLENELSDSQFWVVTMMKLARRVNEIVYKRETDATNQQADTFSENQRRSPVILALSFTTTDESIEEFTIHGFIDDEMAESMEDIFSKPPGVVPELEKYRNLKGQRMTTALRGQFVINKTMYDQDVINALNDGIEKLLDEEEEYNPDK